MKLLHFTEEHWLVLETKRLSIGLLKQYLENLSSHSDKDVASLFSLKNKISQDMSYDHFLGILVPIERKFNFTALDSDITVTQFDGTIKKRPNMPVYFILENIRSAFNVGSIFRTAECFGVEKIYLAGYTSTPESEKTLKTTMGTHRYISWEWVKNTESALNLLKPKNIQAYAMETSPQAKALTKFTPPFPSAYIFGNEKFGLDTSTINSVTDVLEIPLSGQKNSLNVGVAAGIVAFHLRSKFEQ